MRNDEAMTPTALGAYIRTQRQSAGLSLRRLAADSRVSNAYLSQLERGLHQPSLKVLCAIAGALDIPPEEMLAEAGLGTGPSPAGQTDSRARTLSALRADTLLTHEQRDAMINLYKIFLAHHAVPATTVPSEAGPAAEPAVHRSAAPNDPA